MENVFRCMKWYKKQEDFNTFSTFTNDMRANLKKLVIRNGKTAFQAHSLIIQFVMGWQNCSRDR